MLTRRLLAGASRTAARGYYRGPISFSAGVTACPEFGTTRLELTAQADAALYRGKRNGRTVVTIYDPEKDHGHVDEGMRAELSSAITAVIESGALTPVYQPIVELATGRVVGYEGLVRVPRGVDLRPHRRDVRCGRGRGPGRGPRPRGARRRPARAARPRPTG